jgi:hypothetical protein
VPGGAFRPSIRAVDGGSAEDLALADASDRRKRRNTRAKVNMTGKPVIHSMRQIISYGRVPDYLPDRSI